MPKKSRSAINRLKSKVWSAAVQQETGMSAHVLESTLRHKRISMGQIRADTPLSKKFYKYDRGLHIPHTRTFTDMEHFCVGNGAWLELPLYGLEKLEEAVAPDINKFLFGLNAFVQSQLFETGNNGLRQRKDMADSRNYGLKNLYHEGSVDSLAALCALVIELRRTPFDGDDSDGNSPGGLFLKLALMIASVTRRLVVFQPYRKCIPELVEFISPLIATDPWGRPSSYARLNEEGVLLSQRYADKLLRIAIEKGFIKNDITEMQELVYLTELPTRIGAYGAIADFLHYGCETKESLIQISWLKSHLDKGIRWRRRHK